MKYAKGEFFWGRDGVIEKSPGELGVKRNVPVGEIYFPLTDGVFYSMPVSSVSDEKREEKFLQFVIDVYRSHDHYGLFGDIIHARMVVANDNSVYFSIEYIAALAYQKPGLAADLVILVSARNGERFFVGIKRKKNPGAGKVALIGGFRNIDGFEFEPAILTALREASEEVGLDYQLSKKQEKLCTTDLNLAELDIEVELGDEVCQAKLLRVGEFATGDEEKVESLGLKRVYATTVFVLSIDMVGRESLTADQVDNMFKAKDDAKEIVALPLQNVADIPFGLSHHITIMQAALDKVWGGLEAFKGKGE